MERKINLKRAPFKSAALQYIESNPGQTKWRVVHLGQSVRLPNQTVGYRYAAVNDLIREGLVENRGRPNFSALYLTEAGQEVLRFYYEEVEQ